MELLRMNPHDEKGKLIVFCGLDGCGKSSMIRRLAAHMQKHGVMVELTKEPTSAVRNSDIFRTFMDSPDHDDYAYRSLSLLAASDRVQYNHQVILPALRAGKTVIGDRYFYSCLANLIARGYVHDRWIYEVSESIARPDFSFFLDVPVSLAVERVRSRAEEKDRYIDMPLQDRLREVYREICQKNDGFLIPSDRGEEETFSHILSILEGKKHEYNAQNM